MEKYPCFNCESDLIETDTISYIKYDELDIIIVGIPALKCNDCGEEYFTPEVNEKIEKIVELAKTLECIDNRVVIKYNSISKTLDELCIAV